MSLLHYLHDVTPLNVPRIDFWVKAGDAARDLDHLVDEIRDAATSLIMIMALCPEEVDASGEPLTFQDVIRSLSSAGSARGEPEAALAAMQSRLGENGCDEDEFEDLADQFTEDGQDPDELPDNCGTVTAIAVQDGVEIGALGSGEGCPAVGSTMSMTFTVTGK